MEPALATAGVSKNNMLQPPGYAVEVSSQSFRSSRAASCSGGSASKNRLPADIGFGRAIEAETSPSVVGLCGLSTLPAHRVGPVGQGDVYVSAEGGDIGSGEVGEDSEECQDREDGPHRQGHSWTI